MTHPSTYKPSDTKKSIEVEKIRKYAKGMLEYRKKKGRKSMKDVLLQHYLELTKDAE